MATYDVGYSAYATTEPAEWTPIKTPQNARAAAMVFVRRLMANGEIGHGDEAHVHVRGHGAWLFRFETVVRVASVEKV